MGIWLFKAFCLELVYDQFIYITFYSLKKKIIIKKLD